MSSADPTGRKGCSQQLVARGRGCMVSHCSCGNVHPNLGALTLRLDAEELAELSRTLERAVDVLQGDAVSRARMLC